MRLSIRHKLGYTFPEPTRNVTRILRLTPRSHEGQHVVDWQVDLDVDCILKVGEDGFGNITHTFTAKGPIETLSILVTGEVDSFDAAGIVRGSAERMPLELYSRETPLTLADDPLRSFARDSVAACDSPLQGLHTLMGVLHKRIRFDAAAPDAVSSAAAFAENTGNGRDIAHIFTACARYLGHGARVVTGYYLCDNLKRGLNHAWSEVFVPGLGWTGFDAAHDVCPQDAHIRVATGLDALAAASVRGTGSETITDELDLRAPYGLGWGQSQNGQSQSQGPGWQRQSQG